MPSSDPPPAPDYVGAAQAQGAANLKAAIASGQINNPNVENPFGSQTVEWDYLKSPSGKIISALPSITQKFSPEQQALYEKSLATKDIMGQKGVGLAGALAGGGLDLSGLPNAPMSAGQRREDVINAMMSRVNTDIAGRRDNTNSELIAAGIRPGTKAYQTAMEGIDGQETDARQQAILAGGQEATRDFGMDSQARQQALAEMLAQRQTPLNELSALQSGSQVNNPFAGGLGYQAGANVAPAPIAQGIANKGQAAMNQYNAQQAALGGNISAGAGLLGSLGSAAIGAY